MAYSEVFVSLSLQLFELIETVMRTGNHPCSETLLAPMNTIFTKAVILPPPVLAQEERPFQPLFFASAHLSSRSGCLAHSCRAVFNRLRTDGLSKSLASAETAKARVPLPIMGNFRPLETWWTPSPSLPVNVPKPYFCRPFAPPFSKNLT